VPVVLITDYEARISTARSTDIEALQAALEHAGVEFIEEGVRLRKDR